MTRLRPQIHNGLHWVRGELDQSLGRARTLIENHAENPKELLPLQQAYVELHQVRGTASMIQCYGVAAAAEEMKQTVHELMHGKLAEAELAYSVLLGATVQLADYIEAIDGGMDDCALVLQPMINELRLVRAKGVLTECDLFVGQLQALNLALPTPDAETRLPGAAREQARKLLPLFQHSLLHWLRGADDSMASVARMGRIGEQIALHTRSTQIFLLWRSFAACAEALLSRSLDDSLELKRLFGAAGRQIKLLADADEDPATAHLDGLPYQLLFQVGRSRGQGPRVAGLRKVFSLDTYLPDTAQLEALRRKVKGPNVTLLAKVADEIRVDLAQVKDGIDLAVRGAANAGTLKDTRARLKRIGDTLSVLGLPVLHKTIADQVESLQALPEDQPVTAAQWMDTATAILRVESSLEGALFRTLIQQNLDRADGKELQDETPTLRDVREGRKALLAAALVNLSRFKANIDALMRSGDESGLAEAAQMLAEISAGFGIIESPRAAELIAQLERHVRGASFAALRDSKEHADRFADAIACAEYYVEAVRDNLPDAGRMLEDLAHFVGLIESAEPAAQPEVISLMPEPAESFAVPDFAPAPVAAPEPVLDEVDPEIREIFVEEASEVLSAMQLAVPRWARNTGDRNALTDIRRGFHTLKGSGRMVKATDLGEFGWVFESMLNRCLDGAIATSQPVVEAVQQAVELLPELIAGFRDGRAVDARLAPLCKRAQVLAAGLSGTEADPEMVAVFREDARERLQAIAAWLVLQDRSQGAYAVDDEVVRSFHTLRGAAGLVKAGAIHELAGQAESFLESVRHAGQKLDTASLDLLQDLHGALQGWVEEVGSAASAQQDADRWIERLRTLQSQLPAAADPSHDRQLHEIFAGEAFELVQKLEEATALWAAAPANAQLPLNLKMVAHTLHGAALMSGCPPIAAVSLALRNRLNEALAQSAIPDPPFFRHLANIYEGLYQCLDSYREGKLEGDGGELAQRMAAIEFNGAEMPPPAIPSAAAPDEPTAVEQVALHIELEAAPEPPPAAAPAIDAEPLSVAPVESEDLPPALDSGSEVDAELLGIFLLEAQELLENFDTYSAAWEEHPEALEPPAGLKRVLHTLKGSARMAGLRDVGNLAHRLEGMVNDAARETRPPGAAFHARLHHIADGLHHTLDAIGRGEPGDVAALLAELDQPLHEPSEAPAAELLLPPEEIVIEMPEVSEAAPELPAPVAEEQAIDISDFDLPAVEQPAFDAPAPEMPPASAAAPAPEPAPLEPVLEDLSRTLVPGSMLAAAVDADLVEVFGAEATELLETLGHALDAWQSNPHNDAALRDIQRALHTLKGGARMAGLPAMGTAAHAMEERIERVDTVKNLADGELFARLRSDLDALQGMQDMLLRGDTEPLAQEDYVPAAVVEAAPETPAAATEAATPAVEEDAIDAVPAPAAEATAAARDYGPWNPQLFWKPEQQSASLMAMRRETARVPVEQLDGLLNQAGEISIYRSRLEEHNAGIGLQLNEMTAAIRRVREQLRLMDIETEAQIAARGLGVTENKDRYEAEFDPLEMDRYTRMQELSRALSESVGDVDSLRAAMDELVSEAETLLLQQSRISTQVQQGLMSTLMVPFSRQAARLQRVLKQTAQAEGKQAEIVFEGIDSELDRNVLERMTAPLEHLLRNAVVHGIEAPGVRRAVGKPEQGTISLSLRREGTQLLIELRDDGRGLDLNAIREQAVKRGLLAEGAEVGDDALAQFIFEPGFSTARALTQVAGRGIGMDVVAGEVKQLGGTLELGSQAGKGARFLIRLPLNLAMSQTLLVGVGAEIFAIPLASIEGIARIPRKQLEQLYADEGAPFIYGGNEYRVRHLGDYIGAGRQDSEERAVNAILVRSAEGLGAQERRVAVVVDQLLGNREIVTKSVGPQVSSVPGVTGATILADGRVLLIMDLQSLTADRARRARVTLAGEEPAAPLLPVEAPQEEASNLVMVVDDSITIRRVTERLLVKNGYRVVTAKDGLDAMAQLQTERPAVILLDIEMPRADGFEVAAFVRNSERIAATPIIMITSRSGEKHRERARSLGVNRYMIKPYQEEQLIGEIRGVAASPASVNV